jgi:hypothetical protein
LLRLKSAIHKALKSVCRSRGAESSFRSAQHFRIIALLLVPCTLYLIPAMLPAAFAKTVTLGWDSNDEPDLEGYVIYRNENSPGPPYSYSDTVPEGELADPLYPEAKLTGLQEGKEYYIALTAYNTEGVESSFSNEICVEVINDAVEPCNASVSPPAETSSSEGSGGGSGGGGSVCFISTASYRPPNSHLLFYILSTLTIIGIGSCVCKKKAIKQRRQAFRPSQSAHLTNQLS